MCHGGCDRAGSDHPTGLTIGVCLSDVHCAAAAGNASSGAGGHAQLP